MPSPSSFPGARAGGDPVTDASRPPVTSPVGPQPAVPWEISTSRVEAARQSRALTTALGGTCVAIFTFLLFFLYPQFAAGKVDPNLFQLTLLVVIASVYLLVFASWYFFLFTQSLGMDAERTMKHLARADACFGVAVTVLTLAPALVLLTVNLLALGFVALGMWSVYVVFVLRGALELTRGRVAPARRDR